jgi:hypothetical protein
VDLKDFAELSLYLFQDEPWIDIAPSPFGDGIINFKDVSVFAENWLFSTRQACNPNPADGATGVDIADDLNWTPGDGAALHDVYIGSDPCALPLVATQSVGQESYDPPGDLNLNTTYYWRIDEVNDAGPHPGKWPGVLWSFTTIPGEAHTPSPADGATGIDIDADLSWMTGDWVALHEVYFGSDPCALPLVATQSAGQESYDPGDPNLMLSTIYYWRIDEVNDAGPPPGRWPGVLWSFTTIRGEAHTPSPADGAVITGEEIEYPPDSGNWYIWTMLIFNPGPTADPDPNLHRAYFSKNRDDVANRVQDANLGPPPYASTPGFETKYYAGNPLIPPANDTLVRGMNYYWCVDETDADGHTYPGDIWEFTIQGYYAFAPSPPDNAILVDPNVVLSWSEGYGVQDHDIYLGTSRDDVNNADANDATGIYRGFGSNPQYQCTGLEYLTTYYWRIDEVQGRLPPLFPGTIYKGDVWSFTTESSPPP